MKMLMQVEMPIEPFNTYVKEATAGQKLGRILEEIKPEATYFTSRNGSRGGLFVIDMEDASKLPSFAEPFFLQFNAEVSFIPFMSSEDLMRAGLDELGAKWS